MNTPKVKICCIQSVEEAKLALKYGASAIGLVSEMPSGPGVILEEDIRVIAGQMSSTIATFLLTSKTSAEEIIAQHKRCNTSTIQIVDRVDLRVYNTLKDELTGVDIVQVIHVRDDESIPEAINVSKYVDAILLDSGNQKLNIKELGGTGRTHDWGLSKSIVESVGVPVYLAGGLNAENVVEAIRTVNPYGIDLCSGVRISDKMDENLLKEFFAKVNSI